MLPSFTTKFVNPKKAFNSGENFKYDHEESKNNKSLMNKFE